MTKSPERASRYHTAFKKTFDKPTPCEISADRVLNLIISGKMSKDR